VFDGFRAGCVPIYLGPANAADFLPANSVLDYSRFTGVQELMQEIVRWGPRLLRLHTAASMQRPRMRLRYATRRPDLHRVKRPGPA
jgi:hypothetical protein